MYVDRIEEVVNSPNPPYKDRNQQPANDQQIIAGDDVHGVQEAWNQNGAAADNHGERHDDGDSFFPIYMKAIHDHCYDGFTDADGRRQCGKVEAYIKQSTDDSPARNIIEDIWQSDHGQADACPWF